MLDHLFLDTVGAVRAALDASLLERAGQDDRLVFDLLTGDLVWETTVSLPGDGDPPRVSADLSLDWQTWSQSAWRSMSMGENVEDPPEIGIELVFRAQRLANEAVAQHRSVGAPRGEPRNRGRPPRPLGPVIEEAFEEEGAAAGSGRRGGVRGQLQAPCTSTRRSRRLRSEPFPGGHAPAPQRERGREPSPWARPAR